jgi:hypothetical protein
MAGVNFNSDKNGRLTTGSKAGLSKGFASAREVLSKEGPCQSTKTSAHVARPWVPAHEPQTPGHHDRFVPHLFQLEARNAADRKPAITAMAPGPSSDSRPFGTKAYNYYARSHRPPGQLLGTSSSRHLRCHHWFVSGVNRAVFLVEETTRTPSRHCAGYVRVPRLASSSDLAIMPAQTNLGGTNSSTEPRLTECRGRKCTCEPKRILSRRSFGGALDRSPDLVCFAATGSLFCSRAPRRCLGAYATSATCP